jgi:branched-chain amino acid transport system ATP-binding protein
MPGIERDMKRLFDRFPILHERRDQAACTLSGGEQQIFAIGRALMARPKLVLFDGPSSALPRTWPISRLRSSARSATAA